MIEDITVFKDKKYILIISEGTPSLTEFKLAIDKVVALSAEHGITKIIVDSRMRKQMPDMLSLYEGGKYLVEYTRGKLKFAILTKKPTDEQSFFENTTYNRGGRVRFFETEMNAKEWLVIQE